MSGIAGLALPDGPVPPSALSAMAGALAKRGPDGSGVWNEGSAALVHSRLQTGPEEDEPPQPLTLDGHEWISAHARLYGRDELIARLAGKGIGDVSRPCDATLILRAYRAFGTDCLDHLVGDFAFVIWDTRERVLFCARDPFGVRPLYYASVRRGLAVSNTLGALLAHPEVTDRLDDLWVADFLLFGVGQDADATAFAEVKRLPAGHRLIWKGGPPSVERYWSLPLGGEPRSMSEAECVEGFDHHLRVAVEDRVRERNVGVLMSGGLDSTSVAAVASEVLKERGSPYELRAYSVVYDTLIPDSERRFAGIAAKGLGIPLQFHVQDHYRPFDRWEEPGFLQPQPLAEYFCAAYSDLIGKISRGGRVVLTGEGGDEAMLPSRRYFLEKLSQRRLGSLVREGLTHVRMFRRLPPLGFRARLRRWRSRPAVFPDWLNPDLVRGLGLEDRWARLQHPPPPLHPTRPEAYLALTMTAASLAYESYEADGTIAPLEYRHPFLDTRLVSFLFSLPPFPWFVEKHLLRTSMRGRLPEPILRRPKSFLAADPVQAIIRATPLRLSRPASGVARYVDPDRFSTVELDAHLASRDFYARLRTVYLDAWLRVRGSRK